MIDTPTMSLRVPHDPDMRRALREAAKALRQGHVSAEALMEWLSDRQSTNDTLAARVEALEGRLADLEATVRQLSGASDGDLLRLKAKAD